MIRCDGDDSSAALRMNHHAITLHHPALNPRKVTRSSPPARPAARQQRPAGRPLWDDGTSLLRRMSLSPSSRSSPPLARESSRSPQVLPAAATHSSPTQSGEMRLATDEIERLRDALCQVRREADTLRRQQQLQLLQRPPQQPDRGSISAAQESADTSQRMRVALDRKVNEVFIAKKALDVARAELSVLGSTVEALRKELRKKDTTIERLLMQRKPASPCKSVTPSAAMNSSSSPSAAAAAAAGGKTKRSQRRRKTTGGGGGGVRVSRSPRARGAQRTPKRTPKQTPKRTPKRRLRAAAAAAVVAEEVVDDHGDGEASDSDSPSSPHYRTHASPTELRKLLAFAERSIEELREQQREATSAAATSAEVLSANEGEDFKQRFLAIRDQFIASEKRTACAVSEAARYADELVVMRDEYHGRRAEFASTAERAEAAETVAAAAQRSVRAMRGVLLASQAEAAHERKKRSATEQVLGQAKHQLRHLEISRRKAESERRPFG